MANYFPALIISKNNTTFLSESGAIGQMGFIPSPGAGGRPDGDFWAVPVSDFGVVSGIDFVPVSEDNENAAPSPFAFRVFRLLQHKQSDHWYVRGSINGDAAASPIEYGYIQASESAECCDTPSLQLPTDVPTPAGCYAMCDFDADGKYFAIFGVPSTTPTEPFYYAFGAFNGQTLAALSTTGYASVGALVTAMNNNWGVAVGGTFSAINSNTSVKLAQTSGDGTDVLCVQIMAVNPSL